VVVSAAGVDSQSAQVWLGSYVVVVVFTAGVDEVVQSAQVWDGSYVVVVVLMAGVEEVVVVQSAQV
jgi:hypothetical protein